MKFFIIKPLPRKEDPDLIQLTTKQSNALVVEEGEISKF
jgi:hypothetical protein